MAGTEEVQAVMIMVLMGKENTEIFHISRFPAQWNNSLTSGNSLHQGELKNVAVKTTLTIKAVSTRKQTGTNHYSMAMTQRVTICTTSTCRLAEPTPILLHK